MASDGIALDVIKHQLFLVLHQMRLAHHLACGFAQIVCVVGEIYVGADISDRQDEKLCLAALMCLLEAPLSD